MLNEGVWDMFGKLDRKKHPQPLLRRQSDNLCTCCAGFLGQIRLGS